MFIRMLIGRYAGEIRDVREEEAHAMIANGQALNPFCIPPTAVSVVDERELSREQSFKLPRKKAKR